MNLSALCRFLLLLAFLGGHAQLVRAADKPIHGRVVGVRDGDTITILTDEKAQMKIRLEGIDAPELKQPFGQKSKAGLSALLFGKDVIISNRGKHRYKRTLGRVSCGATDVNLEMVRRGLAWRYDKYSKEAALAGAQAAAKDERAGLWQDDAPVPPWEWRVSKRPVRAPSN